MNTRYAMVVIALLLTFILIPQAEAKFAPHAAPGHHLIVQTEDSAPAPFEEFDCSEHHDHEVIAEVMIGCSVEKAGYAKLSPRFLQQVVFYTFRHPPRS